VDNLCAVILFLQSNSSNRFIELTKTNTKFTLFDLFFAAVFDEIFEFWENFSKLPVKIGCKNEKQHFCDRQKHKHSCW